MALPFLHDPLFFQFIHDNQQLDSHELALSLNPKNFNFPLSEALTQIELKKRAKFKLPRWNSYPHVYFPSRLSLEQCSSEDTADYKATLVQGEMLLDLTGGLGIDTISFSRNFKHIRYIESQQDLVLAARHNFEQLGVKNIEVIHADAIQYLNQQSVKNTTVYIDPARRDMHRKLFRLVDTKPNILPLLADLMHNDNHLLLKAAPMLDIKAGIRDIAHVNAVHVVAVAGECKELLFDCQNKVTGKPVITAVDLSHPEGKFSFTYEEESSLSLSLSSPCQYVYEPGAAHMKAAGFKSLAHQFDIQALHPNSHLFTTDRWMPHWPGRSFKILSTCKANKRALPAWLGKRANVVIRNFPLSAEQLKKKLGLEDGGNYFVFGTRLAKEGHQLLICEKLTPPQH